jgi:alpha-L-fucosidase
MVGATSTRLAGLATRAGSRWPKRHWGYVASEEFETLGWVLELLVKCRTWGGNLLLNVGPRPDGTMPDPFYQNAEKLGAWMANSGESLIGADPSPGEERNNVPITRRPGIWYLHVLPKHEAAVELRDVPAPRVVKLLRTGQAISYRASHGTLVLQIPSSARTSLDDVIAVYWNQEPGAAR